MSDIEQGTPEWFAQRCGKATASRSLTLLLRQRQATAQVEQTTWHSW